MGAMGAMGIDMGIEAKEAPATGTGPAMAMPGLGTSGA